MLRQDNLVTLDSLTNRYNKQGVGLSLNIQLQDFKQSLQNPLLLLQINFSDI